MQKKSIFNDQIKYLVYGAIIACLAMTGIAAIPFTNIVFTTAVALFAILILLTGQMYIHSRKLAVKRH